jgi:hypothetical protein
MKIIQSSWIDGPSPISAILIFERNRRTYHFFTVGQLYYETGSNQYAKSKSFNSNLTFRRQEELA